MMDIIFPHSETPPSSRSADAFIQHLAQDEAVEVPSRRVRKVGNAAAEVTPSIAAGTFSCATVSLR